MSVRVASFFRNYGSSPCDLEAILAKLGQRRPIMELVGGDKHIRVLIQAEYCDYPF